MITKNHWGIFTERKVAKASLFASFAGLVIFAATFIMAPYLALEASAESVSASLRWGTVFLELDTENDVEFNNGVAITPSQASGSNYGTMAVEEKTISVNTSAQNYSVFLSMANDATDSALHRAEMSSLTIDPVDATWDEPGNLTGNTWGYAVPETTSPTSQSTWSGTDPEYPSFSSSYTANTILYYDTVDANSTYTNDFAAVPLSSSPQMIYKGNTDNLNGFGKYTDNEDTVFCPNGWTSEKDNTCDQFVTDGDNSFKIYYGVMVNTEMIAGSYSGEIVYTAFASPTALDEVSNNIGVNKQYVVAGDTLTLTFDLTSSVTDLIADKTTVRVVPHADVKADNYLIGSTLEHNKDEYRICTFSSGNMGSGSGSTYTCTMPTGVLGAEYDLWLEVADYNYNYITKSANDKGVVRYAGLSYDDDDDGIAESYILHMQEMTPSICSKLNKWNNRTGENARVLHATGSEAGENKTSIIGTQVLADEDGTLDLNHDNINSNEEILQGNAALNIGTYALIDERDKKTYLIRHLADGNCWMVQNLDLELSTGETLTPSDSDVSADWDPYASSTAMLDGYKAPIDLETDLSLTGGSTNGSFRDLAYWLYGSDQQYQYQPQGISGANYYWGSKRTDCASVTQHTSIKQALASGGITAHASDYASIEDIKTGSVVNNACSEVPRSYSNTTSAGAVQ